MAGLRRGTGTSTWAVCRRGPGEVGEPSSLAGSPSQNQPVWGVLKFSPAGGEPRKPAGPCRHPGQFCPGGLAVETWTNSHVWSGHFRRHSELTTFLLAVPAGGYGECAENFSLASELPQRQ